MTIDKPLYASESAAEEAEMELQSLLEEYKEWKKNNKGSFNDFMKDASDAVRIIKLKQGGAVEDYGDLIDAYEKGIDVREGETLTEYINRIRAGEK
jgi:hypothetical protein|tara:strand:+ start:3037 stop:3324 length:288 start_codon:yes stop_codon:yes gene_type:complete